jgi:branched-chain amino acid transport system substrate-binding protein
MIRLARAFGVTFLWLAIASSPNAQAKYDPGVSDGEIRLGQTAPYSGPVSAYGTFGRASVAYFAMVNEAGGINGRKIMLLTADDGFSPPRTVEQTRKLWKRRVCC